MKLNKTAMIMLFLVKTNYEFTIAMIKMLESLNIFIDKDKLFYYLVNDCKISMGKEEGFNYLSYEELNFLTKLVYEFILKNLIKNKGFIIIRTLLNKEFKRIFKEDFSNKDFIDLIDLFYKNSNYISKNLKKYYIQKRKLSISIIIKRFYVSIVRKLIYN